jgi:hypothetical protein
MQGTSHAERKVPNAGKTTGPRTAQTGQRCRFAKWKHGFYANAAVGERKRMHALIAGCVTLLKALRGG